MDLGELWTEKYRPKKLDEVVGQEHVVNRLKAFVQSGSIPHLLFAGPAGTGKTTCAMAIARELFGEHWKSDFLETNASDERGIDIIRTKIKDFARTKPLSGKFKIIFLDESDALTRDAQQALRRTMESYTRVCRFILSANYSSKIIEPIQSRCTVFRFAPLKDENVREHINKMLSGEGVQASDEAVQALVKLASGDLRKVGNLLQSAAAVSNGRIEEDTLYDVASQAKPEEIRNIITKAMSGKLLEARKEMLNMIIQKGLSGEDVMKSIHSIIPELETDDTTKAKLLDKVGEYEFRILEGANTHIQVSALLAQFAAIKG